MSQVRKLGRYGILFLFIIPLFTIVLTSENSEITQNEILSGPSAAALVPLSPLHSDFNQTGFAELYKSALLNQGAFPSRGSSLLNTKYALQILALNRVNSSISDSDLRQMIMSRYYPKERGFKEQGALIANIPDTYYALDLYTQMNGTISPKMRTEIFELLQALVVDNSHFQDRNVEDNATNLRILWQAIQIMQFLDIPITSLIDFNKTTQWIFSTYYKTNPTDPLFGFFGNSSNEKYEDTLYALKIMDLMGKTSPLRYMHGKEINIQTGTVMSGSFKDIFFSDCHGMNITSVNQILNITLPIQMDQFWNISASTPLSLRFDLTLNSSVIDKGAVMLFNPETSLWENISQLEFLTQTLPRYTGEELFNVSEDVTTEVERILYLEPRNWSKYIMNAPGNSNYSKYLWLGLSFLDSEKNYSVFIDEIAFQYPTIESKMSLSSQAIDSNAYHPNLYLYNGGLYRGNVAISDDLLPSLYYSDGEALKLNSTLNTTTGKHHVSYIMDIPIGMMLQSHENGTLTFTTMLNLSKAVDSTAKLALYNRETESWEDLTSNLAFRFSTGLEYETFQISTNGQGWMNSLVNYTIASKEIDPVSLKENTYQSIPTTDYGPYVKILLDFSDTTSAFRVDIDMFQYDLLVYNRSFLIDRIFSSFSSCFNTNNIRENYCGFQVLELLKESLSRNQMNSLAALLFSFQTPLNGFHMYETSTDENMEATYYAAYLLEDMANYSTSFKERITVFVQSLKFLDGGYGNRKDLSLKATFHTVNFLAQTKQLTTGIGTRVLQYILECKESSTGLYYDQNDQTGRLGDTYYALMLKQIIANYSNINITLLFNEIKSIATTYCNNQQPTGYFYAEDQLDDIYYVIEIVYLANKTLDLPYLNALKQYVIGLQRYHGGFGISASGDAGIAASSYAVKIAERLGFTGNIRLIEENAQYGVMTYLSSRQHKGTGGILPDKESLRFYENDLTSPSKIMMYLVAIGMSSNHHFNKFNTSGYISYIISQIDYFNNLDYLRNVEWGLFFDAIVDRCMVYEAYYILNAVRIQVDVKVDDNLVFIGERPYITISAKTPTGLSLEGCLIYLVQNRTSYALEDHQNGTYSINLLKYEQSGHYTLTLRVSHPNYIGFNLDYDLMICDRLNYEEIYKISTRFVIFQNSMKLEIPIINQTNGKFADQAKLSLYDNKGNFITMLNNDSDRGVYTCSVPVQPWYPQRIGYTLRLEGESIRTEEIEIDSWVFPLNFMIILCSVPAAVIGLTLFRKRYLNVNSDLTKPFGEKLKNVFKGSPNPINEKKSMQKPIKPTTPKKEEDKK
jgi:prenyltransferase beta subunit